MLIKLCPFLFFVFKTALTFLEILWWGVLMKCGIGMVSKITVKLCRHSLRPKDPGF
jgi:hypothetical protein